MRPIIKLDIKSMLPVIRKAFDEKTLQMFTASADSYCQYSGPCAIGVCLTQDQQRYLDELADDSSIINYIAVGYVTVTGDASDLSTLQNLHDRCVTEIAVGQHESVEKFDYMLKQIEEKYLGTT
jgi:hypothetical protein